MVVQYPSLTERVAYPTISEHVDYSAVDGSIRAWYPFTRVQATSTVYGMGVWRDQLYYVAGNKFYRYPNVLLGTLDDEPLSTERAYFVPLSDVLVIVARGKIYLYDTANGFRKFQLPSVPSNTPSTERVLFTADRGTDYGGSATFTDGTNSYTLGDVSDSEPGAHRWFGINLPADRPNYVSELSFRLLSWQFTISTREHSTVEIHADTTNNNQIARVVIPYPYVIGEHTITLAEPLRLDTSLRIKHFVRHSQTWRKQITFRAVSTPRHYAITQVVSGIESQPRYFDVSNAGVNHNDRYWVRFTSNLPTGTYRIYRADSAGVYRLVAQRSTTTAFTDWLSDDELGEPLVVHDYPARADMAILYNRRAVLVDGNKVYVSAPARFSFSNDDGSETIELHDTVIGLAVYNGILYVATRQGWYALLSGDTVYLQATQFAPPFAGYVGQYIYTDGAGVVIGGDYPYRFLNNPIVDIVPCGDYRYLIDKTGKVYTQFHNGKITAMAGVYRGLVVFNGELYAYGNDGIYKHSNLRGSARLKWTISLDQPANLYTLRINGYGGDATLIIQSREGNRTRYDTLPIKTVPRVEHDNYHITLELSFSGNTVLQPPILVIEPRYQHTRGEN
jgi:hypothetical protein